MEGAGRDVKAGNPAIPPMYATARIIFLPGRKLSFFRGRRTMRYLLVALSMLLCSALPAQAQVSVEFGFPGVSIGINVPAYPRLVRVPGYPVYYDPRADTNYFFYDGLYWVYQADNWYTSSWYNGPWELVEPYDVPVFLLRVPVRYYRHPPSYFHGWRADAPPRWGEHWGGDWENRRRGWDQWDRRRAPAAAPLPSYQRQYSGDRYPRAPEQQVTIRARNYRYQPRETVTQQLFQRQVQPQVAPGGSRAEPPRQAPAPQRSPAPQQRVQPSPPRQEPQSIQPRPAQQAQPPQSVQQAQPRPPVQQVQPRPPVQQAQPRQPVQQAQPKQPPVQAQRAQTAPQGKGQEGRAAPQGKGQEGKAAPRGKGRQENKNEEGDRGSR